MITEGFQSPIYKQNMRTDLYFKSWYKEILPIKIPS